GNRSTSGGGPGGWRALRSSRGLVSTGLVLVALLALVAVATRGHRGSGGATHPSGGPSNGFVSYAISTYFVIAAAMVVFVVLALVTQRESLPAPTRRRDLRSLIFFVLVIALVSL